MKQIIFSIVCYLILSGCGLKKTLTLESNFKEIQNKE